MPQQAGKAAAPENTHVLLAPISIASPGRAPASAASTQVRAKLGSAGLNWAAEQQRGAGDAVRPAKHPSRWPDTQRTRLHAPPAPARSESLSRRMGAFLDPTLRAFCSQSSLSPRGLVRVPSPVGAGPRAASSPRAARRQVCDSPPAIGS